jgi:hypothetical protein
MGDVLTGLVIPRKRAMSGGEGGSKGIFRLAPSIL